MKDKLTKEQEERRIKEEETRLLHILLHKKSNSIAGCITNDKSIFVIKDSQSGIIDEDEELLSLKMVTNTSHKNLTYFRPIEWLADKIDLG